MTIMDDNGSIVGDTEVDECMFNEGDHPKCRRCGQPIVGHIYYGSHGAECETCWRLPPETYIPKKPCIQKRSIKERYKKIAESQWYKDAFEGKSIGEVIEIEE